MSTPSPKKLIAAATLLTASLAPAQDPILQDIIAYYPLDTLDGTSTPDLVNGYNMAGANIGSDAVVTGRFGNAFSFNGANQILTREHLFDTSGAIPIPQDELPLEQHENFSISLWVNATGGSGNSDGRIIGEGSLSDTGILFGFGTAPGNANPDKLDVFIRAARDSVSGGIELPHSVSEQPAFDGTWHHILFVQEGPDATVYIDGVLQTFTNGAGTENPLIRSETPVRPLDSETGNPFTNVTAIGGVRRTSASNLFRGLIDEVGMWSRALTAEEATRLSQEKIPDPNATIPLSLSSFSSERPTSVEGGTAVLSWQGSAGDTYILNPGGIDVTAMTLGGVGKISVPITEATTYELTASREGETPISLTTEVGILPDVPEGWVLLGNFESFELGEVADEGAPFWKNPQVNRTWDFTDFSGNTVATSSSGQNGPMSTPLGTYAIEAGTTRTLFFHVFSPAEIGRVVFRMGATSKALRGFSNDLDSVEPSDALPNGDFLGAYLQIDTGTGDPFSEFQSVLLIEEVDDTLGRWIAVWMEVTNTESGVDVASVYAQVSSAAERALVFENQQGDGLDSAISLDTFYIGSRGENEASQAFYIDNIFISEDPVALGTTPVPFPPAPAIVVNSDPLVITSITVENGSLTVEWNGDSTASYTVERSTNLSDWSTIGGDATGNTFSEDPPVTSNRFFYRVSGPNQP